MKDSPNACVTIALPLGIFEHVRNRNHDVPHLSRIDFDCDLSSVGHLAEGRGPDEARLRAVRYQERRGPVKCQYAIKEAFEFRVQHLLTERMPILTNVLLWYYYNRKTSLK